MKRTFMKFLPIAAAVLLATSCSKDEGNTVVDNIVTPDPVQEVVEQPTFKTITITGKLSQNTLSKVTTSGANNRTLVFDGKEEFSFSDGDDVKGTINIAAGGTYTAEVTFSDETKLTTSSGFTAYAGNVPDGQTKYESLKEAVEAAYYIIDFQVNKEGEDSYSLSKIGDASKPINVENNSAFIYVRGVVASGEINFEGGTPITSPAVGKYYIVPAGVKMGSGTNLTVAGKIYNVGKAAFSVDASNKVEFALGNLQYQASTGTWQFAANQWDYIGDNVGNTTETNRESSSDWIDLFGWGMWLKEQNPYETDPDNSKYLSSVTSGYWGDSYKSAIGADWRTLTSAEWTNIFNFSDRGTTLYSKAIVHGVNGVVLLPDSWNGGYTFANTNTSEAAFAKIEDADWDILAAQGAVFLPAAGSRDGTSVYGVGSDGIYWSSTAYDASNARFVYFYSVGVNHADYVRYIGRSVRLVRNL